MPRKKTAEKHDTPKSQAIADIQSSRTESGEVSEGRLVLADITERKQAEEFARLRLALFEFSVSHSLEELLQETLDEVCALTGSPIGFYHFMETDQKTLSLQAWSTRTVKEFCKAQGKGMHYPIDQAGVWVDCVHERRPVIHNDYSALSHRKGMPEGHAVVTRQLVVPIMRSGQIVAILGIGNKPADYTENDVEFVSYLADVAWEIVERKRAEEELVLYRDHLKELVRERTAELARMNDLLTHEIEERKKAENALRESQQMLQLVLDTIPARVFWKDLDSNYLGCNRPFALDAGLHSPEEIVGRNDFEMVWAEQAELFRSYDRLVMQTGSSKLGYEEPQTAQDGSRIWLRTNKVPLCDVEGRIKGVLGTYEDITESKRMDETLRASETRYRIVADNTYDWEYWASPEGRFLYTSPSCQRITGYTASEFEVDRKLLSRIVHPDDLAQFEAHVRQGRNTTSPHGLEFRIIHRDGTTRWIGHLCQPVFDAQGAFLGRRGSNRDITDRKQAEKAVQESSQELKLFAYSVAHDLKSPAIGIYGITKRLSKSYRDVLDEKGRSYCDQILRTSEHIAALVDKVNVYIATKEARLSIERVNIGEVLRMLEDEFSSQLNIRQIDWLKPETSIEINADRLSMVRAFRNFVDNSLKYGGERLTTIWTGYEESEDFHIFSFGDNGKGLKDIDSEKIFGAFQRKETSREVEGTGLGLTIVKEIAEQHGGKVWVEPRTKKGITFYISISKNL